MAKIGYKGYERRDRVSHRKYNLATAMRRFQKTGKLQAVDEGQGHAAGYKWAKAKGIDPHDNETKYSKNSPSFDEGVALYKLKHRMASKLR